MAEYPDNFEDDLREYLSYDPDTGKLWWKKPAGSASLGRPAGGLKPSGYRQFYFRRRSVQTHRVAFLLYYGRWPVGDIDHINGNPSDNRICNLREATRTENLQNIRKARVDNTSGFLGVSPRGKRWRAQIAFGGRHLDLGTYDTPEDAYAAYVTAKRQLHKGCTI